MGTRSAKDSLLDVATLVTTACALGLMASIVLGARSRAEPSALTPTDTTSVAIAQWDSLHREGRRLGGADAEFTIVEFGDYECPACAGFAKNWKAFAAAHPGQVSLVFRHWPLPYHRFAYPAARAAECAARQGRFAEMHDLLYARQDSLGLLSFTEMAHRAGVADTSAHRACVAAAATLPEVERDRALAAAIGARGTPALVVNGIRLGVVPDSARLEVLFRSLRRPRPQGS